MIGEAPTSTVRMYWHHLRHLVGWLVHRNSLAYIAWNRDPHNGNSYKAHVKLILILILFMEFMIYSWFIISNFIKCHKELPFTWRCRWNTINSRNIRGNLYFYRQFPKREYSKLTFVVEVSCALRCFRRFAFVEWDGPRLGG